MHTAARIKIFTFLSPPSPPTESYYREPTIKILCVLFVPKLPCMHAYFFKLEFSGLHTLIQVCTLIFLAKKVVSARLFRSARLKIIQNAFMKSQILVCTTINIDSCADLIFHPAHLFRSAR